MEMLEYFKCFKTVCVVILLVLICPICHAGTPCGDWTEAVYYDNSCYKFFTSTKRSWQGAYSACQGEGAYLAELTTQAEMAFFRQEAVNRNLNDGVWLGATRVSGTVRTVTAFAWDSNRQTLSSSLQSHITSLGFFENQNNRENCLEFRFSECSLNDLDCSQTGYYLCERAPIAKDILYLAVLPTGNNGAISPVIFISTTSSGTDYVDLVVYHSNALVTSISTQSVTSNVPYTFHLDGHAQLEFTGIHHDYIKIYSSSKVNVLIFCTSPNYAFATNILAVADLKPLYVIVGPPEKTGVQNLLSITALTTTPTNVTIRFPCRNLTFTLADILFWNPSEGAVTLNQYETALIKTDADLTGSVISANQNIAVFIGWSSATSHKIMQALPLTMAGTQILTAYLTGTRVQSLQHDTTLMIYENPSYQYEGGYLWDLEAMYELAVIGSNRPFLALASHTTLSVSSDFACLMPLIPTSMWKSSYQACFSPDIHSTSMVLELYLVIARGRELRMDGTPVESTELCQESGTTTYGSYALYLCLIPTSANPDCYTLHALDSQPFMAYVHAFDSGLLNEMCYPLEVELDGSNTDYKGLNTSQLDTPFNCLVSYVEEMEHSTAKPTPEIDSTTSATTSAPTTATTANPSTTPETTSTTTTTTTTTTTATTVAPDSNQLAAEIRQTLVIDVTSTSQYRRKKISILDKRISSTAIGIVGLACCVVASTIIFLLDVSRVAPKRKKQDKGIEDKTRDKRSEDKADKRS